MTKNSIRLTISALLIFFMCDAVLSQDIQAANETYHEFNGMVKNSIDGLPIEYASIFIEGKAIGTVSNSIGEFQLKIPASLLPADVFISSLGYSTLRYTFRSSMTEKISIALVPNTDVLATVDIKSKRTDSSVYILNEAIRSIKFNYPRRPHLLEGFFRMTSVTGNEYTRIIEAALRLQEGSYQQNSVNDDHTFNNNRVEVIEIRKTEDSRDKNFITKLHNLAMGEKNELYDVFDGNYVRILNSTMSHFMTKERLLKHDSELLGTVDWENTKAYKIQIDIKDITYRNIIFYIDKKDFAILRIERFDMNNPKMTYIPNEGLIEGKYITKAEINFRKINFKYYPVLIRKLTHDHDASFDVKQNGKLVLQYSESIFLLTDAYERGDFDRIKAKHLEDKKQNLSHDTRATNEVFWKNYNTVLIDPIGPKFEELKKR